MLKHAGRGVGAVLLGLTLGPVMAAPTATLLEYGVYSADPVASPPEGTPLGRYQLLEKTRRIPLRLGTRFGFCARFEGLEVEGKYTLTEIVRHPVMVQPNGVEVGGWNVPRMVRVDNGRGVWCGGFQFTKEHELVPGTWRFTVGDSDADLLVEEFETVR
jgi:hypothetical protein